MSQDQTRERRQHIRIIADVRCWLERESITLLGTATNMSTAGLFLRTPVPVAAGSRVSLRIDVEGGIVLVQGYVVWTVTSKENKRYSGLGICFDKIIDGENLLEKFVEQNKPGRSETNQPRIRT